MFLYVKMDEFHKWERNDCTEDGRMMFAVVILIKTC